MASSPKIAMVAHVEFFEGQCTPLDDATQHDNQTAQTVDALLTRLDIDSGYQPRGQTNH